MLQYTESLEVLNIERLKFKSFKSFKEDFLHLLIELEDKPMHLKYLNINVGQPCIYHDVYSIPQEEADMLCDRIGE